MAEICGLRVLLVAYCKQWRESSRYTQRVTELGAGTAGPEIGYFRRSGLLGRRPEARCFVLGDCVQHARVWLKFELKEVEVERANKLVKWTARVLKLLQNIMLSKC